MQSAIGTGPQEQAQRRRARRQKICFAFGNLGQSAFYNAMSTFFMTYTSRPRCSCAWTRASRPA